MKKIISILFFIFTMSAATYSQTFTVVDVFNAASKIDGFQEMEYVEDAMKFPPNIGTALSFNF